MSLNLDSDGNGGGIIVVGGEATVDATDSDPREDGPYWAKYEADCHAVRAGRRDGRLRHPAEDQRRQGVDHPDRGLTCIPDPISSARSERWQDIPGWFQWRGAQEEAVAHFGDGSRFVEVGCYLGKSLCSLAEVVRDSGRDIALTGVDTARGSGPGPELQHRDGKSACGSAAWQ